MVKILLLAVTIYLAFRYFRKPRQLNPQQSFPREEDQDVEYEEITKDE